MNSVLVFTDNLQQFQEIENKLSDKVCFWITGTNYDKLFEILLPNIRQHTVQYYGNPNSIAVQLRLKRLDIEDITPYNMYEFNNKNQLKLEL